MGGFKRSSLVAWRQSNTRKNEKGRKGISQSRAQFGFNEPRIGNAKRSERA